MDRNPETIVIFATYADEMKEFLDSNPGLGSRVAQTINFPSYEEDTLLHILQNLVNSPGYTIENAAEEEMAVRIAGDSDVAFRIIQADMEAAMIRLMPEAKTTCRVIGFVS